MERAGAALAHGVGGGLTCAASGAPPWLGALATRVLHRMLPPDTDAGAALQRFLLQLLGPRFAELGLEPRAGEPAPDALARRLLARWACALGDARCVRASVAHFARWRKLPDEHTIPADMRSVVLCTAVEHGSAADWQFLWERYANATSSAERSGVLQALGCSRDPATLSRFLQMSIQKDSAIRKQHSASVFEAVAKNPVGHNIAKEFLKNNIDRIQSHIGTNPFHLPQLLQALAYRMNTPEELREAEHEDSLRVATRTLQQSHEAVRFNIDWVGRHRDDIAAWLRTAPQAAPTR
ncbi:Aminopeptidase N precursor, putative, partial [Gryllus bimaculatus]